MREIFQCPQCWHHYWRTHGGGDMATAIGECRGCGFNWRRSEDDKYFFVLVPRSTAKAAGLA